MELLIRFIFTITITASFFLKNGAVHRANDFTVSDYDVLFTEFFTQKQKSFNREDLGAILNENKILLPYTTHEVVAKLLLNAGPKLAVNQPEGLALGRTDESQISTVSDPSRQTSTSGTMNNDVSANPVVFPSDQPTEFNIDTSQMRKLEGQLEIPVDMDAFEKRAIDKVKKFTDYVEKVLESEDRYQKNVIIKQARILFVDDTCIVQVSNVNSDKKKDYTVRQYFEHIKDVGKYYSRVDVTMGDVYYVSNLRKLDDGNWYGTVSFIQKFSGFKDDLLVYQDRTTKNVTVVLKIFEPEINGDRDVVWDVLLSNVLVEHTTR